MSTLARLRSRWAILAVGTLAQASACSFVYGIPMLLPALRSQLHLSLVAAGIVVSAPMAGLLLTLIAWGAIADRFGERLVIASGVLTAAVILAAAARIAHAMVALCLLLFLAGAAAASVFAASGRVVMGWFPARSRGFAMGVRQTAQPLGVAIAALSLPPLAHHSGVFSALLFPAVLCAGIGAAVLLVVVNPPRPALSPAAAAAAAPSPYRGVWTLWRVHAASSMLVVPQFAVATFTVAYLVGQRHWDPITAGRAMFAFQVAGAAGRIGAGIWSDTVRSRLSPMRQLAIASAVLMAMLGLGAAVHARWIVAVFAVAAVVTVADNGLAFTAVAEIAGSAWAGRALGAQNTAQNLTAVITAPALAAVIGAGGYALGFLVAVICPVLAIPLTPIHNEPAADAGWHRPRPNPARQLRWRRMRDSNPRGVAPNTISNRAP
jgi:sugar phosphate permease